MLEAQQHVDAGHDEVGQEADRERLDLLGLLGERVGEPDHESELRNLGRLHVDGAEGEPARRPSSRVPEPDDARCQENARDCEERVRELVETVVVEQAHAEERDQRRDGVGGLTLQEELGIVVLHGCLHGGRAVDHDDTEARERHGHRGQDWIDRRVREAVVAPSIERRDELDRCASDVPLRGRGRHRGPPGASARTSRTNSSPLCL